MRRRRIHGSHGTPAHACPNPVGNNRRERQSALKGTRRSTYAPARAHNPSTMNTRTRIKALVGTIALAIAPVAAAQEQPPPDPAPATPQPDKPAPPSNQPPAPSPAPTTPPKLEPPVGDDAMTEIVVYLTDGRSLTGLLVRESKEELVLKIAGIETPVPTSTIDHYQFLEPIIERYRKMRAAVGDVPDQIATLVVWLQAREQYELALTEVDRLLRIDPHHQQGLSLRKALVSQIELRNAARPKPAGAEPQPRPKPVEREEAREPFPLLSQAQIDLIKVFEIDFKDPPRILISRETIQRLLEAYAGSPLLPSTQEGRDALYRKPPLEILDLMFRLRARDFYADVKVLDQPRAMRMFRDDVQAGWLVNSCATNQCHGGRDAGRLILVNRKPRSEAATYTNFLILERFKLNDGTPLLNYDNPAASPLLQMTLPRHESARPHPEVPLGPRSTDVWKPLFRNSQERGFQRTVEWMKAMYKPRPEYPIEYRPPGPSEPPPKPEGEPSPR